MFRKIALGLFAAATLGAVAFAPAPASANGLHIGIGGIGFHSGWHGGYHNAFASPTLYVGGLDNGCMQKRYVETRRGMRARWVSVCNY